jgi:hypothetical protein
MGLKTGNLKKFPDPKDIKNKTFFHSTIWLFTVFPEVESGRESNALSGHLVSGFYWK